MISRTRPGLRDMKTILIGQKERLDDVVRDEHDSHVGLGNDLIQQLLHAPAGFGVEGAERLVHERDLGLIGSMRAMATRCFMPPESCVG